MVLNQAVLHARKKDWLVMFISRGWAQVFDGVYVEPVTLDSGEVVYDNPLMSVEVLRGFWKAHHEKLSTLPIQHLSCLAKYEPLKARVRENWLRVASIPGREQFSFIQMRRLMEDSENPLEDQDRLDEPVLREYDFMNNKFQSLEDLLLLGVAWREVAGLVVVDLVRELKSLDKSIPVMFAIDQINNWELQSSYAYENKPVLAKELCVPHALKFLSSKKSETNAWSMDNGLCIAATSGYYVEGRNFTYEDHLRSIPFSLCVPHYSQLEYLSTVLHYMRSSGVPANIDLSDILTFRVFTNSNPKLVRREAPGYFLPISAIRDEQADAEDYALSNLLEQDEDDDMGDGLGAEEEFSEGAGRKTLDEGGYDGDYFSDDFMDMSDQSTSRFGDDDDDEAGPKGKKGEGKQSKGKSLSDKALPAKKTYEKAKKKKGVTVIKSKNRNAILDD